MAVVHVGTAAGPLRTPYAWIAKLREKEALGLLDETIDRTTVTLEPDTPVRVISGPLEGFVGKVVRAAREDRVAVLFSEFDAISGIEVPVRDLTRAAA